MESSEKLSKTKIIVKKLQEMEERIGSVQKELVSMGRINPYAMEQFRKMLVETYLNGAEFMLNEFKNRPKITSIHDNYDKECLKEMRSILQVMREENA